MRENGGAASTRGSGNEAASAGAPIPLRTSRRNGELRGQLLVEVDAEARLLRREHVAVLDLRAAREHLGRLFREAAPFVDAEVVRGQLQGELGGVGQGGG